MVAAIAGTVTSPAGRRWLARLRQPSRLNGVAGRTRDEYLIRNGREPFTPSVLADLL